MLPGDEAQAWASSPWSANKNKRSDSQGSAKDSGGEEGGQGSAVVCSACRFRPAEASRKPYRLARYLFVSLQRYRSQAHRCGPSGRHEFTNRNLVFSFFNYGKATSKQRREQQAAKSASQRHQCDRFRQSNLQQHARDDHRQPRRHALLGKCRDLQF